MDDVRGFDTSPVDDMAGGTDEALDVADGVAADATGTGDYPNWSCCFMHAYVPDCLCPPPEPDDGS